MKYNVLLILAGALTACTPIETKKNETIPPLSSVASLIKPGMNMSEATKSLSGHKVFLQYSNQDRATWEIVERTSDPNNHAMNTNRLTIQFNNSGKVTDSTSTFCFLPDIEPQLSTAPETHCYQKQLYPFEKQLTYDAIKRLLIISNYQVDHSDAASEIISATGMHGVDSDKDKMMFIKLSIIFSAHDKSTEVIMSATFSMSEKQSTWVQAGFGGITLPVPLPFQRTEEWIDSGIVTPKFYLEFYDALSKLIAREYLPYKQPVYSAIPATPAPIPTPPIVPSTNKPVDNYIAKPTTSAPNNTIRSIDAELSTLEGPIDGNHKASNQKQNPTQNEGPEEIEEQQDIFSELNGKPIDSGKLNK